MCSLILRVSVCRLCANSGLLLGLKVLMPRPNFVDHYSKSMALITLGRDLYHIATLPVADHER